MTTGYRMASRGIVGRGGDKGKICKETTVASTAAELLPWPFGPDVAG